MRLRKRKNKRVRVSKSSGTSSHWWDDTGSCCLVEEVFPLGVLDGPCFVATASYGDFDAPQVRTLRAYRDQRLARSAAGRLFTRMYYRYGRYGAVVLRGRPRLKAVTRTVLGPVVAYAARRVA